VSAHVLISYDALQRVVYGYASMKTCRIPLVVASALEGLVVELAVDVGLDAAWQQAKRRLLHTIADRFVGPPCLSGFAHQPFFYRRGLCACAEEPSACEVILKCPSVQLAYRQGTWPQAGTLGTSNVMLPS
jgi:hypothetical protein